MNGSSFFKFLFAEKERVAERCTEIDQQTELLNNERAGLMDIQEALEAVQELYEDTGQCIIAGAALQNTPTSADKPEGKSAPSDVDDIVSKVRSLRSVNGARNQGPRLAL